ncbi:uncharacterized protein SOCE26_084380 [Sorangium cellulosum]|uniref:Uncharacterized protein n=1 Tax=Sorangium cellulosum TaxID=56 RepID=A0A2L0F5R1_SORCE|nr:DUF4215 domain-containing protein [Sorangium cellulosum]AUX46928.1 uncharacterized protein SOCE26_084380 [Sorangium cellulosum]
MSYHVLARPRPFAAAAALFLLYACDTSTLEGLDTTDQGALTDPCPDCLLDEADDGGGDQEGYLGAGGAPLQEECGNGVVQRPAEQCDDANDDDEDGCMSDCTLTPISVNAVCGDGVVQTPVEQCDDANTDDDDGCANDCVFSTVVFAYSGVVTGVTHTGSLGPQDSGVVVGDPFTGTYYFDPHMHDGYGHPFASSYEFENFPGFFGHQAQVGPLTVTSVSPAPQEVSAGYSSSIAITDGIAGYEDSYTVSCGLNAVAGLPSWDADRMAVGWNLYLSSLSDPSAVTSTALSETPPDLSKFEGKEVVLTLGYSSGHPPEHAAVYVTAELTSLTRVP